MGKEKQANLAREQEEEKWTGIFSEFQKFGVEMRELLELIGQCDLDNVIHSAKITRCEEAHKRLAQQYLQKTEGEVEKIVKQKNSSGDDVGKHLAVAIGEQPAKPLANVRRDRDIADGGNAGQMTSNPADVDAIVKRAWQQIHKGTGACITKAVDAVLDTYCDAIYKRKPFEVARITDDKSCKPPLAEPRSLQVPWMDGAPRN